MKRKIKILIVSIFTFVLLLNMWSGFIYKNNDDFVYVGFSGLKSIFNEDKFKIYFREFLEFELNGIDGPYIFKDKSISVNKENKIIINKSSEKRYFEVMSSDINVNFPVLLTDKNDIEPYQYITKNKISVISDIEGDFELFYNYLFNNKIIDKNCNWIFGSGHLICLGDFFDRGSDVTATLWLCYKLEQEAEKEGGKVHFILGNHEINNTMGLKDYVHTKYKALSQKTNIDYTEFYSKKTILGNWLRSKNSIEIVNNILFCHGGISPNFFKQKLTINNTNEKTREAMNIKFNEMYNIDGSTKNNPLEFFVNQNSPLWYRGYFIETTLNKKINQNQIDSITNYYKIEKIIVGHTIIDKIKTHYNGKVIGIDVPRYGKIGKNIPSALLIENNKYYATDELGRKFDIK